MVVNKARSTHHRSTVCEAKMERFRELKPYWFVSLTVSRRVSWSPLLSLPFMNWSRGESHNPRKRTPDISWRGNRKVNFKRANLWEGGGFWRDWDDLSWDMAICTKKCWCSIIFIYGTLAYIPDIGLIDVIWVRMRREDCGYVLIVKSLEIINVPCTETACTEESDTVKIDIACENLRLPVWRYMYRQNTCQEWDFLQAEVTHGCPSDSCQCLPAGPPPYAATIETREVWKFGSQPDVTTTELYYQFLRLRVKSCFPYSCK